MSRPWLFGRQRHRIRVPGIQWLWWWSQWWWSQWWLLLWWPARQNPTRVSIFIWITSCQYWILPRNPSETLVYYLDLFILGARIQCCWDVSFQPFLLVWTDFESLKANIRKFKHLDVWDTPKSTCTNHSRQNLSANCGGSHRHGSCCRGKRCSRCSGHCGCSGLRSRRLICSHHGVRGSCWMCMDKLYIVIHQTETEWDDLEISSRKPSYRSEVLVRLRQLAQMVGKEITFTRFCRHSRHTSPATGISEVETVSVVSVVSVVTSPKSAMNGARDHVMNMTCCKKNMGKSGIWHGMTPKMDQNGYLREKVENRLNRSEQTIQSGPSHLASTRDQPVQAREVMGKIVQYMESFCSPS